MRVIKVLGVFTFLSLIVINLFVIFRIGEAELNPLIPALSLTALLVSVAAFILPVLLTQFDLALRPVAPYLIAGVSLVLSIGPWLLVQVGNAPAATAIYQGLRIPQGIVPFWDLNLVLQSVDCAAAGVDVYAANNGCLADPSIYAPGSLWLQYVPFDLMSARNSVWLGVTAMLISVIVIFWIARLSGARGQIVLLIAMFGAPWLLILERGNFDLFVIWAAAFAVFLTRRWNALWAWWAAAGAFWLVGSWKYYPFVLGIMLIPALKLRYGWTVLVGFFVAVSVFVVLTWENVKLSLDANSAMVDLGDFVVLGRVPLVARMWGGDGDSATYSLADLAVFVSALVAVLWGVAWGRGILKRGFGSNFVATPRAMLAIGGSSLFLISVLVGGFGYAYKATFLLLAVPLVALPFKGARGPLVISSVVVLTLVAVASVVVWNTVLATSLGIVAASFAFGAAATVLIGTIRLRQRSYPPVGAAS